MKRTKKRLLGQRKYDEKEAEKKKRKARTEQKRIYKNRNILSTAKNRNME
eukprot:TRINITY_DN6333_c0_g1_i1.p2 TRINITY_DN6333_c0_g1~~TRINITY_DN6333_c0_g1_i1.p2  ORF type:complete len:50 (+),score=4.53 TRINITY_DN6333_c0_g1_i1:2-151(+)